MAQPIPSLALISKFLWIINSGESHLNDIVKLLRMDVYLCAEVLRKCNIASINNPTTNLHKAIQIIRMDEVLKILIHKSLAELKTNNQSPHVEELCKHVIRTAHITEKAAKAKECAAENAYLTGMMHCISLFYLNEENWSQFIIRDVDPEYLQENILNYPAESADLLKQWNFPEKIIQIVRNHQDTQEEEPLCQLLGCASLLSWFCLVETSETIEIPDLIADISGLSVEFWGEALFDVNNLDEEL